MHINKTLVNRFQKLHVDKYGTEISYELAELNLRELASIVRIIHGAY